MYVYIHILCIMYSCYLKDTLRWMVDHTCQGMVLCSLCSRAWCSHKADQWQTQSSSNETNGCREIGGRKDQTKKFKLLQLLLHPQSLRVRSFFRWWQLKYFLVFHPYLEKIPNFDSIFFRWVGSTTKQFLRLALLLTHPR